MKSKIFNAIMAIISIMAIIINMNPEVALMQSLSGNSIIYFFIFIFVYSFSNIVKCDKKSKKISFFIAVILTIMMIVGRFINEFGTIFIIDSPRQLIKIGILAIGYQWLVFNIIKYIYGLNVQKLSNNIFFVKLNKFDNKIKNPVILFFLCMVLILIAWIPVFLRCYPGVITNDSLVQIYQGTGNAAMTSHHPVIHTLLIGFFLNVGKNIKDYNLGIALYSIFQMIIMASIFSYSLIFMKRKKIPIICRIITLIYYMFYQVHAYYAISMWKDVLFGGVFLLTTMMLIDMVCEKEKFFGHKINIVKFIILITLTMSLRNNGLYAIVLSAPFLIFFYRKNFKKISVLLIATFVVYFSVSIGLKTIFNVEAGNVREALSIPMQQLARTVRNNIEMLDSDEEERITKFIKLSPEEISEKYDPKISDPIKEFFDGNEFSNNKLEFIDIWMRLLKKYPRDYIDAFIENCYGYWYPEASHWVTLNITQNDEYLGIHENHVIEWKLIDRYKEVVDNRSIPVVSMIYSIGFMVWLIIILLGRIATQKFKETYIVFIPLVTLIVTTIASPVFCEFRYVYSIFTCMPVLIYITFMKVSNKEEENEGSSINTML